MKNILIIISTLLIYFFVDSNSNLNIENTNIINAYNDSVVMINNISDRIYNRQLSINNKIKAINSDFLYANNQIPHLNLKIKKYLKKKEDFIVNTNKNHSEKNLVKNNLTKNEKKRKFTTISPSEKNLDNSSEGIIEVFPDYDSTGSQIYFYHPNGIISDNYPDIKYDTLQKIVDLNYAEFYTFYLNIVKNKLDSTKKNN